MKFYLDTSVFGGYWDDIFEKETRQFLEYAEELQAKLIYSNITERELKPAPQRVRELPKEIVKSYGKLSFEVVEIDSEIESLADKYIKEKALTEKCRDDARHIAAATVHGVSVLVTWNFKHMINFLRMRHYDSINIRLGYNKIDIRSPRAIIHQPELP